LLHGQGRKIQEQGATIDGLNTHLLRCHPASGEGSELERDKVLLGVRINTAHRRVIHSEGTVGTARYVGADGDIPGK